MVIKDQVHNPFLSPLNLGVFTCAKCTPALMMYTIMTALYAFIVFVVSMIFQQIILSRDSSEACDIFPDN